MQRIHVVAGIIYNKTADQILIAKRLDHLHQGGLWEFPGGKVEVDELPKQALLRELKEELSIAVNNCSPFMHIEHDYVDKQVLLDVWQVIGFSGDAKGVEGQEVCWVSIKDLSNYQFPKANEGIVERLKVKG